MYICLIVFLLFDFMIALLTISSGYHKRIPRFEAERLWHYIAIQNASLHFEFQQRNATDAVLFAAYSGRTTHDLLLSIESSTKRDQITVSLRSQSGTLRNFVSNVSVDHSSWNQVILLFNDKNLELFLNCTLILQANDTDPDFKKDHVQIFLGQTRHKRKQLYGIIRGFSVEPVNYFLQHCSASDSAIKQLNGGDYVSSTQQKSVTYLAQILKRVVDLEADINKWLATVQSQDQRLKRVELYQRGCQIDKRSLAVGQKLRNDTQCTECVCSPSGEVSCGRIGCAPLTCDHPVLPAGQCCPICAKECFYNGKRWQNGQQYWPKKCVRCICDDGNMACQFLEVSKCPKLDCEKQEVPPNECCPVCVDTDFCGQANPCDLNAQCENGNFGPECRCKSGYFGNGTTCHDIDECIWDDTASEQLGGCLSGTMCINLPGSFKCECLPGYRKLNERNCMDVLRV